MVKDNLRFKRKFEKQDKSADEPHERGIRNFTYYLSEGMCEEIDSPRLRAIADNVFKTNNRRAAYGYLENYAFTMANDDTGYFNYSVRVIHGYQRFTFDQNRCAIVFRTAHTGKF